MVWVIMRWRGLSSERRRSSRSSFYKFIDRPDDNIWIEYIEMINPSPPSAAYMHHWTGSALTHGLSPAWCQVITWTNDGLLSIEHQIQNFPFFWLSAFSMSCENWYLQIVFLFLYHFFVLSKIKLTTTFLSWKCFLPNWQPFCPGGDDLSKVGCC